MRNTWIAISLCLGLLGAAGCASEEDREKERLRGEVEARLEALEELVERRNMHWGELYPARPPAVDNVTVGHRDDLAMDLDLGQLAFKLDVLEQQAESVRRVVASYEQQLAAR